MEGNCKFRTTKAIYTACALEILPLPPHAESALDVKQGLIEVVDDVFDVFDAH